MGKYILTNIGGILMLHYPLMVFIDTNVFISCKYNLNGNGYFSILKKFIKDGKIKLHIDNIVRQEVEKHIKSDIDNACGKYKNAYKEIPTNLLEISEIKWPSKEDLQEKAVSVFQAFLEEVNVQYLDNKKVDLESILKDYFECNPPFEKNIQKKYEFPDAIIISKIKQNFNGIKPLYIISQDEGFRKSFSEEEIYTFVGMNELFDLINKTEEKKDNIYQKISLNIERPVVHEQIVSEIEEKILSEDIEIDGLDYDRKGLVEGYEYDEINISNVDNIEFKLVSVDDINDNSVALTILCYADIEAICSFTDYANSAWDGEEKRYRFLSKEELEENHHAEFECSIEFRWADEAGEMRFDLISVDFDLSLGQYTRQSRKFISYVAD